MSKVLGYFYGYRKFAVDRDWLREQEELRYQKRQQRFEAWSKKWITITRLKQDRLWTDGAIKRWLGQPKKQGKYKVFSVEAVIEAEKLKEFQEWRQPRIEKMIARFNHYMIPFL